MIRISQLKLPVTHKKSDLEKKIYTTLKISSSDLLTWHIEKKSLDARKKPNLFYVYTIAANVQNEKRIIEKNEILDNQGLAKAIAKSVDHRPQLLKILSMNHYDLEENSRIELLTEFKVSYGKALQAMEEILAKFRADMDHAKRQEFVYTFFPFMFGIYPYTIVTEKQKRAMKEAGVDYAYTSVYDLTYAAVIKMLR